MREPRVLSGERAGRGEVAVVTYVGADEVGWWAAHVESVRRQWVWPAQLVLWSDGVAARVLDDLAAQARDAGVVARAGAGVTLLEVVGGVAAPFVWPLRVTDRLLAGALSRVEREIDVWGEVGLLYGDELLSGDANGDGVPVMRCAWGPWVASRWAVVGEAPVVAVSWLRACGGSGGWGDLAALITGGGGRVRHVPSLLLERRDVPSLSAQVEQPLSTPRGLMSVIIPTCGSSDPTGSGLVMVGQCLRSLAATTAEPNRCEVIVVCDEGTPPAVVAGLSAWGLRGVRVIAHRRELGGFNFSAMVNEGALAASGEVLVFVNDDVRFTRWGWDVVLGATVCDRGVGVVGGTLVYPDGRLQHAGFTVQLAQGGLPIHAGAGIAGQAAGHHGLLGCTREVHAVTGAVLGVRREVFLKVGGFSTRFPSDYNDVDLCWKTQALGLSTVVIAGVMGEHWESATRDAHYNQGDAERLRARWADAMYEDPWRNPNIAHEDLQAKPDWRTWERGQAVIDRAGYGLFPPDAVEVWGEGQERLLQPRVRRRW